MKLFDVQIFYAIGLSTYSDAVVNIQRSGVYVVACLVAGPKGCIRTFWVQHVIPTRVSVCLH